MRIYFLQAVLRMCLGLLVWTLVSTDVQAQSGVGTGCNEEGYLSCSDLAKCQSRLTKLFSKLQLARCQEAQGLCDEARATYQDIVDRALTLEAPPGEARAVLGPLPERVLAEGALAQMEAQCPRQVTVELVLAGPIEGVEVFVDDELVQSQPGLNPIVLTLDVHEAYVVQVTAEGFEPWSTTVTAGNRDGTRIEVPRMKPVVIAEAAPCVDCSRLPSAPVAVEESGPNPPLTLITVGTGAATIVSAFWYFSAQRSANEAYETYTNNPSDGAWQLVQEKRETRDTSGTVLAVSAIAFGASSVLLGSEWAVRASGDDDDGAAMTVVVDTQGAVAVVKGAF